MIARFLDALEPAGRIGLWLVLLLWLALAVLAAVLVVGVVRDGATLD